MVASIASTLPNQLHADTVNTLLTLSTLPNDGDLITLAGYYSSGDGGGQVLRYLSDSDEAIDGGFVFPGPNGVLQFDGSNQHYGNKGDGRFVAIDRSEVNVLRFGAQATWTSGTNGINAAPAISRALATAKSVCVSEGRNSIVCRVPVGHYKLEDSLVSDGRVWWQANGARFIHTRPSNTNETVLTIGDEISISNARMVLPSVWGYHNPLFTIDEAGEENFIAIRVKDCRNSQIHFQQTGRAAIAIRLQPKPGGFIGYNQFHGVEASICKIGLDLRGNTSTGWVNENTFYSSNFSLAPSSHRHGSLFAVRFSSPSGGYTPQNNNRFIGPSFQVPGRDSGFELVDGMTVNSLFRYVNPTTDEEYLCTNGGTLATVPTHTGQLSVTQPNGVTMKHVGPYFRSPVLFDGAGESAWFRMCRWEGGDGPFAYVKKGESIRSGSNSFIEIYREQDVDRARPRIDMLTDRQDVRSIHGGNKLVLPHSVDQPLLKIDNVHKRLLANATHAYVQGMNMVNYFQSSADHSPGQDYWTGSGFTIGRDWLYNGTGQYHGFLIDMQDLWAVEVHRYTTYEASPPPQYRIHLRIFDEDKNRMTLHEGSTDSVGAGLDSIIPSWHYMLNGTDDGVSTTIFKGRQNPFRYAQVFFRNMMTDILVKPIDYAVQQAGVKLLSANGVDTLDYGPRRCFREPTMGHFDQVGEMIQNLDTASGQPWEWRVKRPGIMALDWAASTDVYQHEFREVGGNVYKAQSAGTTGTTTPSGTGSGINDGGVVWDFWGAKAELITSSGTY